MKIAKNKERKIGKEKEKYIRKKKVDTHPDKSSDTEIKCHFNRAVSAIEAVKYREE